MRWLLPLLALACLAGGLWIGRHGDDATPEVLLASARASLESTPPERLLALRALDEGLRLATGPEWSAARAELLRERSKLHGLQGLRTLALADCRTELEEFGPGAETLARAADLCLALGELGPALEYAEELARLEPVSGKARIGRARVALADAPLAALDRLARTVLPPSDAASARDLAQRAAVFASDANIHTAALEELLEHFSRPEHRRAVSEWVAEASEHFELARVAFVGALEPESAADAVAGLQDLLLRAGAAAQAADLGRVALSLPELPSPMAVLARTATALASLDRLGAARTLIQQVGKRPDALLPQSLPSFAARDELAEWCLLLADLRAWNELAPAAWELFARWNNKDRAAQELSAFLIAQCQLGMSQLNAAALTLEGLGTNPVDQYDIPERAWLARAAIARKQNRLEQERYAISVATRTAPLDPPLGLRAEIGGAWRRLYELQKKDGDVLAAEISLTHALRCLPERAAELEPLWNEVGRTSLATRGASSPYTLYVRAKSASDRDQPAAALTDARKLLEGFPGLGPALEIVARCSNKLRDYPQMIAASLELIERGWPSVGASTLLRSVPKEYFLPQDRVRWLLLDPRGSLEAVVRTLLARDDVRGAADAARAGPAQYQPPELLPLLADVEARAGDVVTAFTTLELLPVDSEPFRASTALALRVALAAEPFAAEPSGERASAPEESVPGGEEVPREAPPPPPIERTLARVLASGTPADPRILAALDVLLAAGHAAEVDALLAWLAPAPPELREFLLRTTLARVVAGASTAVEEDLERAASLLDDGRPELGRLVLALEHADAEALARDAGDLARAPFAASLARRAALLTLSAQYAEAAGVVAGGALDGRDLGLELVYAALGVLAPDELGTSAENAPELPAGMDAQRLLVLALAADAPPWSAWVLARCTPPAVPDQPLLRALRADAWLALGEPARALAVLEEPGPGASGDARLAWLRVRALRARGASADGTRAAELAWFTAVDRPADLDVHGTVLDSYLVERDVSREDAVRRLETAREAHRDEPELVARLAELESTSGRRTQAIALYGELLALLPPRSDDPQVLRCLDVLRAARDEGEISEPRWWSEVEALEALRPSDPAPVRELCTRAFERPVESGEDARTHAVQRFGRLRTRTYERSLETLRAGEVERWTELFARFSPERAVALTQAELLSDPSDPALWRASAHALLASGQGKLALERLEALRRLAPDPETARLLAMASFRYENDPARLVERLKGLTPNPDDPVLAFYRALSTKAKADQPPPLQRALDLWAARDTNGLADPEHGRTLALALHEAGARERALVVLDESLALAGSELEHNLFEALAFLVRAMPVPDPAEVAAAEAAAAAAAAAKAAKPAGPRVKPGKAGGAGPGKGKAGAKPRAKAGAAAGAPGGKRGKAGAGAGKPGVRERLQQRRQQKGQQ